MEMSIQSLYWDLLIFESGCDGSSPVVGVEVIEGNGEGHLAIYALPGLLPYQSIRELTQRYRALPMALHSHAATTGRSIRLPRMKL